MAKALKAITEALNNTGEVDSEKAEAKGSATMNWLKSVKLKWPRSQAPPLKLKLKSMREHICRLGTGVSIASRAKDSTILIAR